MKLELGDKLNVVIEVFEDESSNPTVASRIGRRQRQTPIRDPGSDYTGLRSASPRLEITVLGEGNVSLRLETASFDF